MQQFDESKTDALPLNLLASFPVEPLWLIVPGNSTADTIRMRAAKITATIKGLDLAEIISEDTKVHKRNVLTASIAALLLTVTTVGLGIASYRSVLNLRTIFSQQKRITDERNSALLEIHAKETAAYQTDIAQAYGFYFEKDFNRSRSLIDSAFPDLRSWEWHYLNSRLDQSRVLDTFQEPSTCIDLKPDKTELAVCSTSGRVEIFSLLQSTSRYLNGPTSPIKDLKYSSDGSTLLVVYESGKVLKWDLSSGKTLSLPNDMLVRAEGSIALHEKSISAVAIDSRGDAFVYAPAEQGRIRLYSTTKGAIEIKDGVKDAIALAFSPDGKYFISAGWSGEVTLFRVGSPGIQAKLRLPFKINSVAGMATPGLAAVACDKGVILIDLLHRRTIATFGTDHEVAFVRADRSGNILTSGSTDGTLRVWSSKGALLKELFGHRGTPRSAVFDDSKFKMYSVGEALREWNLNDLNEATVKIGPTLEGHLCLSGADGLAAISSDTRGVFIVDINAGRVIATLPVHGNIARLAFTPDEKSIVIQHGSGLKNAAVFQAGENYFEVWNVTTRKIVRSFTLPITRLTGAVLSRTGNLILADHYSANEHSSEKDKFSQLDYYTLGEPGGGARKDKEVVLLEATSGTRLAAIHCDDHNLVVADCDYSGRWCATGHAYRGFRAEVGAVASSFGAVNIIDRRSGKSIRLLHPEGVRSIAFSSNGSTLAVAGDNGTVQLIDLDGFQTVDGLLAAQRGELSKKAIPDFGLDMLDSIREDPAISTAINRRSIDLHTLPINVVLFAPHGARVITGSSDGAIKFGGLDGHDYGTAFTNATPILDVAWSQDGKKLLAFTGAGELKIWQIRQVGPMEEARTLVSKANDLMKAGGTCSEALRLYDSAVMRYKSYLNARRDDQIQLQFAGLLTTRGAAQAQCTQSSQAESDFAEAIHLCETGDRGAASGLWADQLRKTLLNRAVMLVENGKMTEARNDLDRVVQSAQEYYRLEGNSTDLRDDLARAYSAEGTLSLKQRDSRRAISEFSKAIDVFESIKPYRAPEVDMSFAMCLHNRAIAYAERGDETAALKDIDRAIDITSELIEVGVVGAKRELDSNTELRNLLSRKSQ